MIKYNRIKNNWQFIKNVKFPLEELTNLTPIFNFYPPENVRKPEFFWRFSGGIEMEHWFEMRYINLLKTPSSKHKIIEQRIFHWAS